MATTKKTGSKTAKTKEKKVAKKRTGEELEAKASSGEKREKKPAQPRRPLQPRTPFAEWGALTKWRVVDAAGQPVGRLSSQVAMMLMGKDKPAYTRHADSGDAVVVINASQVVFTGNKWNQKKYYHHTNYPGGIKETSAKDMLEKNPERIIERAVYGMLPKGHMGRRWYGKLRVFAGADHPHAAQKPEAAKLAYTATAGDQ